MKTETQERRPRFGRAISLALVGSLALFCFFPGSVFAAGSISAASTANTNCSLNTFEWRISLSGFSAGEAVTVDALFASDELFNPYTVTSAGSLDILWTAGGTSANTLNVTVYDANFNPVAATSAIPNCTPAMPTTKSQCDGNGWTAFAVFKNRGQCTAYVTRGVSAH